MEKYLEFKSIPADGNSIKDIDEKKGIVTGYFSIFGNKDSDSDIILPGAFKKTLSENYRRVKHLYQHDPLKPLSGTKNNLLVVKEDNVGLYFESQISQTSWGKDAIRLYMDGVVDEQSIGYKTIKAFDRKDYRELTELYLYEGSMVTWGANEMARTTGMKSLFTPQTAISKMDNILKALKHGKYENEEIFDVLEYYFKQLQQYIADTTKEESTQPDEKSVEPDNLIDVIKQFRTTLNQ